MYCLSGRVVCVLFEWEVVCVVFEWEGVCSV